MVALSFASLFALVGMGWVVGWGWGVEVGKVCEHGGGVQGLGPCLATLFRTFLLM